MGEAMIDPSRVRLFIPPGLKGFKQKLFDRIGSKVGGVVRHDYEALGSLPDELIPVVGCSPPLRHLIELWAESGRTWIYWDRGYARRVFATWLPRGDNGGYYRWSIGTFQMHEIRDVPDDRWRELRTSVKPWNTGGRHIVLAEPSPTYMKFHRIDGWVEQTLVRLREFTDRPIVQRTKETSRSLEDDCENAHCLVTHGSNAAVEAVIMGCPVFVHSSSAAALVGQTDLATIEEPIYPERQPWLNSLAYCQFNEDELVNGTLWRLIV